MGDDEFTVPDRAALSWAVSTGRAVATAFIERMRAGGAGVTSAERAAIRRAWERAGCPAPEQHVHRTRVVFPDGTPVTGVSFLAEDPYRRDRAPAFGLYLDQRWHPPWAHRHIDWPDFGVPADVAGLRSELTALVGRARRGDHVEVGCLGGHGRTGTALACIAVLTGTPATGAVAWVRANYCDRAVETDQQDALVRLFGS